MRSLRYWVRLLGAFFSRFRNLILIGAIVGAAIFVLLPRLTASLPIVKSGETIGITGRFLPEELPLRIQSEISVGLTTVDEEFNILPGLADEWHAEEDGRIWIFKLGEHTWQDGKPIEADQINYNFRDVETEVIDNKTIKFILKDPFSPFPSVVSRPAFKKGLLGAGEWRVTKLAMANRRFVESIRLKHLTSGQTKTYRFYPSEETARIAFKLGEVDSLEGIVDPEELKSWDNVLVEESVQQDRYVGIFINTLEPLLSDKSVRQALAYAINKEDFEGERAISPISPKSWAFNPQVKPYTYSPERARELLGSLSGDREKISVNLVTTPTLLSVADKVKEYWEEIGIKTNIQVSNTPPSDFQALIAIQVNTPDPDQYSIWHSTQLETNITNYGEGEEKPRESQRIDKLLEDGRRALDPTERKQIYIDFQRFLVEDSPVIFLYHPKTYIIKRN